MGETLYRRPEILFRWGRLCFDTVSPGEISYQSRGDSVSGETLFRDTGHSSATIPSYRLPQIATNGHKNFSPPTLLHLTLRHFPFPEFRNSSQCSHTIY